MQDTTIEIPSSKWFTSTDLKPRNIISTILFTGFENEKNYKSYIFFDILNCPKDFYINSAVLRIYLKQLQTSSLWANLYTSLINEDINELNTFVKCHEKRIYRDFHGWININIIDIIYNNEFDTTKNKGLILSCDEKEKSLFIFNSSCTQDDKLKPKLIINYCPKPPQINKCFIGIKEHHWTFDFFKNEISPIVNIEYINQGTFFINNVSNELVNATIQVSDNSINWINDSKISVDSHSTGILIPMYYGKYYRIFLTSQKHCCVKVSFIFQFYK